MARFNEASVRRLMNDAGIVRHQGKIRSTINNARRAIELVEECGSLSAYFQQYRPRPSSRPRRMTYAALMKLTETAQCFLLLFRFFHKPLRN